MKDIPSGSIDLILTDPPYGISGEYRIAFRNGRPSPMNELVGDGFRDDISDNDMTLLYGQLAAHFDRILKPDGSILIFHDRGRAFLMKPIYDVFRLRNMIAFYKINPIPHMHKNNYRSGYEQCAWFSREKYRLNFLSQAKMINVFPGVMTPRCTEHPTEKPAWMIEPLIIRHSKPGDLILDPFVGSGRTCVEAKKQGRKYIGIDINPKWCDVAMEWLKNTPESAREWFR